MKRAFSLYLFLALILFSLLACQQTQEFTGTTVKKDLSDVQVKLQDGEFQSVYTPGSSRFIIPSISSKQTVATIKIVVGDAGVNVKIRDRHIRAKGETLEFVQKLNLKTGVNVIPFLIYREDESRGSKFEIEIERKASEGALRLTYLKCAYKNYSGKEIETDDFVDELPFHGIYEKQFATDGEVLLKVGSPELEAQLVTVDGAISRAISTSAEYKTYSIKLKVASATPVDITVYDTNKGLDESFHLMFTPLSSQQKQSTDIETVFLTTEFGDVFDFEKLDMSSLKPYRKGKEKGSSKPVTIESIFKCRELLGAGVHAVKPTLSVVTKEPGAKVELLAVWNEIDHDQSRKDLEISGVSLGWEYNAITTTVDENFSAKFLPVLTGPDTDTEFKFTPYNQMKFDLLIKVTSPDGTKKKYHEIKYNFPFALALFYDIQPFKAMVKKGKNLESRPVVTKVDENDDDLFNVYVPAGTESVRLLANDTYNVNLATGYRKSYSDIWDFRFYLSLDDGPFSRTHPVEAIKDNYKEVFMANSDVEEHKLAIVSYQDGRLTEDGTFVDEYGKESGVAKVQSEYRFKFIKENRNIAPALTVFKIEGEQDVKTVSNVRGKIWPTISFRPSVHDYKVALLEDGVKYKFKMLKTDPGARILVDGQDVRIETFTQQVKTVSDKYPEVIDNLQDDNVQFFSYELKRNDPRYYQNGKLKACTIPIIVEKNGAYREYSIEVEPVNPKENDITINVVDSNFGSSRSGVEIYYKEHQPNKELTLTADGKLYKGDFSFLGTTGADGKLSGKGKLEAGVYYDIYALGDDRRRADSMIEHYYVSGAKDEILDIVQVDLTQSAGADYKEGGRPIRGNCPVRLRKQVAVPGTATDPPQYADGAYLFFRQREKSSGSGGLLGGGRKEPFRLTPVNLTCGDAHIKMVDTSLTGTGTDFVTWFDVSSGNSVEPVSWGPDGVVISFDAVPNQFSDTFVSMTDYNPNGQIGMNDSAVDQQSRMKWDFPSGVFDLIIVAYDVAGNRLERHQLVSIEHSKMMEGAQIGGTEDNPKRRLKIGGFRMNIIRMPLNAGMFEQKDEFERLFGMPWVEYTPPEGQGDKINEPSTCLAYAMGYLADSFSFVRIQALDLYRRCVEDNTPFKKVGSTVSTKPGTDFYAIDADFSIEEGKTYQYKMIACVDEGQSVETEYLAEVKIPPSFMYFLDSLKVKGQGAHIPDGTVYKYNSAKNETNVPLLKKKKYPSGTAEKDKEQIKIDYRARLSTSVLWDKEYADRIDFGITLVLRDSDPVFVSKCALIFTDEGDEELLFYVPNAGRYIPLTTLLEKGFVKAGTRVRDLVTFDKKTCLLTIKDDYLRIPIINWLSLDGVASFKYEAGCTYYWDIVSYGRHPYGSNVSALKFQKFFEAKKKDNPTEVYLDEDGDTVVGGFYTTSGNSSTGYGNNSINGKCRFSVVEE